jgi:hypothetical protein
MESSALPTETEEGKSFHAVRCITPPEMENPPSGVKFHEDDMVTKKNLWEGDKQKAKDFWKSRDKDSPSNISYQRKGVKPKIDDRIHGEIIPESNLQAFVRADDENNEQKQVHAVDLDNCNKTHEMKLPSLAESKEAQVDVQRSREVESSPLPAETDNEAVFVPQHRITATPPETQNPPTSENANEDETVTKKNVRKGDEQKVKDFWKSRDKGSACRNGAKPKVNDRIDGGIIPESNLGAFIHADDKNNEQQQVHAVELEDRDKSQKTKPPSLAESNAAQLDVLHGGDVESPPLETDDVAMFVAQRISTTQQETENLPTSANTKEDDIVTKEKVGEANNRQKMSTSAASFWKSRDKGTASHVLYRRRRRRKDKQVKAVAEEGNCGSPHDTEIPLLADSKPEVNDIQKMESRRLVTNTDNGAASDTQPRISPLKTESPPVREDMMANETTEEKSENRKYAKLSGSVVDFWKLKEQSNYT